MHWREITLENCRIDDFTRLSGEQKSRSGELSQNYAGREMVGVAGDEVGCRAFIGVGRDVEAPEEESDLIAYGSRTSTSNVAECLPAHVGNNQRLIRREGEIRRTAVGTNLLVTAIEKERHEASGVSCHN